jgi:ABC-2 type transport system permease protein
VSPLSLAWAQFRFERRMFWRNPSAAFFNFALPLLLLVLIGAVFATQADEIDILIPGIAGMSVVATTFTSLAFNLTYLRQEGILKRIRGVPIPTAAYLAGLLGSAVMNAVVQVAIVVLLGKLLFGIDWPQDLPLLAAFTALGVACFASLGVAFSHAIPNADSAPAYTNAVFLPLIFISGTFYSADDLPPVLKAIAESLPLTHVIDGMSAAIVGGDQGSLGVAALVIAGWTVAGLFIAVRFFRWE